MGRYALTHDEADRGKFKMPSWAAQHRSDGPYMHDSSPKDLMQVLDFYIGGENSHPNLDKEILPLDFLTGKERQDLLAFPNSVLNWEPPAEPLSSDWDVTVAEMLHCFARERVFPFQEQTPWIGVFHRALNALG